MKIELTSKDCLLVREAIAHAVRTGTFSQAKKKRLVDIAEHVLLKAVLSEPTPPKTVGDIVNLPSYVEAIERRRLKTYKVAAQAIMFSHTLRAFYFPPFPLDAYPRYHPQFPLEVYPCYPSGDAAWTLKSKRQRAFTAQTKE